MPLPENTSGPGGADGWSWRHEGNLREGVEAAIASKAITYPGSAEFLTVLIHGALNAVALRVGGEDGLSDWRAPLRQWFEGMRIIKTVQTVQHFE